MKEQVSISMLAYASADTRRQSHPGRTVAAWFIALHAFGFHAGVCATWLLAWVALGRRPIPMMDDPKNFGSIVQIAYSFSALLLVLWFVVAFLAVFLMVALFDRYRDIARLSALMGCAYVIAFCLLRWDPGNVVCWFMD